jgi:hypothetical protein
MPRLTHRRGELRAQVGQVLRSLGDSEQEVAGRLEAAGVRGRPGDPGDCALAVYVSAVVGADPRVRAVRVVPVQVRIKLDRRWRPPLTVPLPKALRRVVLAFDCGRYPTLVRPRSEAHRCTQHAAP